MRKENNVMTIEYNRERIHRYQYYVLSSTVTQSIIHSTWPSYLIVFGNLWDHYAESWVQVLAVHSPGDGNHFHLHHGLDHS